MQSHAPIELEKPETASVEISLDGLEGRVARLEATVAELRDLLHKLLTPHRSAAMPDGGYGWVELPEHLEGVTDYSQLEPEELVYIHELTDEDVRLRLEELERWYGMRSEDFYVRWRRGEADDVFHRTEWSILYEDWLQIEAASSSSHEEAE